jgi:hypothetical protein
MRLGGDDGQMRTAAAFLKAVATADGEGIRILATYADISRLLLHLSALTFDACSQPAADPADYLDGVFKQLDRNQR